MNTVGHIINPFAAPVNSDLFIAQPITLASMIHAQNIAKEIIDVKLYSTKYKGDEIAVPHEFIQTVSLEKSVLDSNNFNKKNKLPFLIDILERLYNASEAEYLIYSNIDIGLYPQFYLRINELINSGYDAFIINRRRISDKFKKVSDLNNIYKEQGKKHPGFDCFVFHRSIFPKLKLDGICIGVPFIEISFSQNLFCLANHFKLVDNEILTFHLGMEIFKKRMPKEYFNYNKKQFCELIKELNPDLKKFPYSNYFWPFKIIRWGLHPCIPIKLVILLLLKKTYLFKNLNFFT